MQIELDSRKTVEQNAADYYENSKKFKKKLEGLKKAISETEKLLKKAELKEAEKKAVKKITLKKEWFERFHWMIINGYLVIGGRDAKTNEFLVKKHMEKEDLFFHADVHGASVIIAKKGQELDESELELVAQFAGCFTSAWKAGRGTINVYSVLPEQVKTAAKSGEYLAKGSFVITGERKYYKNVELKLGIAFEEDKLLIKPVELIKGKKVVIKPDIKKSKGESSKLVLKKLKEIYPDKSIDVNWVQDLLPNGGSRITQS